MSPHIPVVKFISSGRPESELTNDFVSFVTSAIRLEVDNFSA